MSCHDTSERVSPRDITCRVSNELVPERLLHVPQGASSLASSLDSSLTLCGFGPDLPDDDLLLSDVLLPDEDLLDLAPDEPATMKAPENPPIGLKLKKSASLVDLINAQLSGGCAPMAAAL